MASVRLWPWLSRSATNGNSPSPLTLPSPSSSSSNPSTPTDVTANTRGIRARRRSSLEALELLEGLAEGFDAFALGQDKQSGGAFIAPELEQVAVTEASAAGLQPEVDHQGNIEYKLKIAMPTSIHRLEKLRTQLKWRLVEGGGTAVYELGLLDNGTLVGLNQEEMEQSLKTLAQMLAGLGGGRIQISRVIQIGLGCDPSSSSSSPPPRALDGSGPSSPCSIFPSFDVLADSDDISFVASGTPPVVDPVTGETSIFPPPRIRGPIPFPADRSEEQQAAFRRDKRDARRARKRDAELSAAAGAGSRSSVSSSSLSSSLESSRASTPASSDPPPTPPITIPPRSFHASYPSAIEPRTKPPKPPKPPRPTTARLRKLETTGHDEKEDSTTTTLAAARPATLIVANTTAAAAPQAAAFKPILPQDCDEVRYVVEAIVHKAGYASAVRRRRKSSSGGSAAGAAGAAVAGLSFEDVGSLGSTATSADQDGSAATASPRGQLIDGSDGGEEDGDSDAESLFEGDEGWNYLEFDLSAAAAAATAAHAASHARASALCA
ncbi:hypothetical protein C6P46_004262 [Rhodotorula mucilaginosa]|uniref:Uncharacterized protein n=1 Tax=Rhodotorula mucilaginosa TaxID=5537 RepID=A0A9P6W780_RHOMI|nr:hypothetical protein C6P46_004262 [Rhodotorula mucilaginosa]